MSPNRRRRSAGTRRVRRAELVKAVAVGAGIVGVTALLIWLMRPGPAGVPATGGLMNRQPRSSWLVGSALALGGGATWWILAGSRRARRHARVALPVSLGVIAAGAVVAGFLWPGGLLRHDVAPAPATPPPSTTAATATTVPATGASTTTAGAPASTSPTSTTPTTSPASTPTT